MCHSDSSNCIQDKSSFANLCQLLPLSRFFQLVGKRKSSIKPWLCWQFAKVGFSPQATIGLMPGSLTQAELDLLCSMHPVRIGTFPDVS
jgi:hypothetical protein